MVELQPLFEIDIIRRGQGEKEWILHPNIHIRNHN